ncbi:hypothetical protein [uncultured Rhodoferax sp.]|uniref:hypothetical protein n=1 Tax=uncultured Rhodoferax sp. TaxID=223188 RepID=UPI0025EB2B57|nr:hypothetical protein [uncultured Rhodoferax sp.]
MTLIDLFIWQFVWLPLLTLLWYPVAIQFERGGWWRLLFWAYIPVGLADVWLNYTTLVLYMWDRPRAGEYTFSRRIKRLKTDTGWRGSIARVLRDYLNFWQAGHV